MEKQTVIMCNSMCQGNGNCSICKPIQVLNPDLKKYWLEELRSGKYIQAYGAYRVMSVNPDDKLCMCAIGILKHIIKQLEIEFPFFEWSKVGPDQQDIIKIIDLNDSGQTLEQIADYIEANL